jgi:hypothetical protein
LMKAGRAHDRTSEAQARALWASSERVRRETPIGGRAPGLAGRRVVDSHGTLLGSAGELLADPLDGGTRWLEVNVRGLGAQRLSQVPADGLQVGGNEVRAPVSRDHILRAPVVAPGPLTREGELALCRHYGLSRRAAEITNRAYGEPTAVSASRLAAVAS